MATSVGSVFLEIVPSVNNFASKLSSTVMSDVTKAGQDAGKAFGDALSQGSTSNIAKLKSDLSSAALATEQASTRVAQAHATAANAADKVGVAEAKLAEARQKYSADSSQVTAAEARLAAAKRDAELQSGKTALAEKTLTDAQEKQAASAKVLKDAQDSQSSSSAVFASKLGGLGAAMTGVAAVTAGVAIHSAADYQTSLDRLVTTAGETQENIGMVGDGMLKMAGEVGTSATDLSAGMYTIESAGFHGADGLNVLKAAAQGAKMENASLGTVSNAVTDILTDYHLPALQAADVTSKLIETVSLGKTNFEELSSAMSAVAPVASAAHIPLQDMLGDISEMTAHGVSAQQATQNLANTIRTLANPTQVMTQELAQVGIRSDELSQNLGKTGVSGALEQISAAILQHMGPDGAVLLNSFNQSKIAAEDANKMFQSLPPNLQKLAQEMKNGQISQHDWTQGLKQIDPIQANLLRQWLTATKNADGFSQALKTGGTTAQSYTQALAKATGNSTAMNVALMLTGENAESTSSNISKIAEATDDAGYQVHGWADIQGQFNLKLAQAKDGMQAMAIGIGQALLPVATKFVGVLGDMGSFLGGHTTLLKVMLGVVGGLGTVFLVSAGAMKAWTVATDLAKAAQLAYGIVTRATTAAIVAEDAATEANPITLIIMAIIAAVALLAFGIYELVTHWKQVWGAISDAASAVYHAVILPVFDGIKAAWNAVVAAFHAVYNAVLKPVFDAIATAVRAVGAAFSWLWNTILHPVFTFIGEAASIVAKIILAVMIAPIVIAIRVLGPVFTWLYQNAIKPAFDAIAAAASWLYQNVFKPVFDAIGAAVRWVYENVLLPIWVGLKAEWKLLEDAANWLYLNVFKPIWDAIGTAIRWVYDNILMPIWIGLKAEWKLLEDAFHWMYENVFRPVWQALGDAISWVYHNVIQPVWDAFKTALGDLENVFRTAIGVIGDIWDGLKKAFGTPIEFVIRTVLNNGIIKGINWILNAVGLSIPTIPDPNLPTFATGGVVPGYAPGQDTVHAMLSPGEGVLVPQAVVALGGARGVDAINALYGAGGGPSRTAGGVPGYSLGGIVGDILGGIGNAASTAWNGVKNVALGGLRAAASAFFGGVVNPLVGLIPGAPDNIARKLLVGQVNKIEDDVLSFLGKKDQAAMASAGAASSGVAADAQHYAASRLPKFGWGPDQMGPLIALWNQESGWNPNAVNPSSGAYGIPQSLGHGHPYNLGDYVAQIDWGLSYIASRYGSPAAAEAHEVANHWYDDGGYLQPGLTRVVNASGRPEPVFSPSQWDLIRARVKGGNGDEHHYHISTLDPLAVATEIERRQRLHNTSKF